MKGMQKKYFDISFADLNKYKLKDKYRNWYKGLTKMPIDILKGLHYSDPDGLKMIHWNGGEGPSHWDLWENSLLTSALVREQSLSGKWHSP